MARIQEKLQGSGTADLIRYALRRRIEDLLLETAPVIERLGHERAGCALRQGRVPGIAVDCVPFPQPIDREALAGTDEQGYSGSARLKAGRAIARARRSA